MFYMLLRNAGPKVQVRTIKIKEKNVVKHGFDSTSRSKLDHPKISLETSGIMESSK